jgi:hypothetical protein
MTYTMRICTACLQTEPANDVGDVCSHEGCGGTSKEIEVVPVSIVERLTRELVLAEEKVKTMHVSLAGPWSNGEAPVIRG